MEGRAVHLDQLINGLHQLFQDFLYLLDQGGVSGKAENNTK